MRGLSLLVIDDDTPGITRHALMKTGWLASDTATLSNEQPRREREHAAGLLATSNAS